MVYSFQLWRHPNILYRDAVVRLARCELYSMLKSISVEAELQTEELGSATFLSFQCRMLTEPELSFLSGHSAVVFMAENRDGLLFPLKVCSSDILPEDLPEILKYKGKTNPSFTRMMLNTAKALASFRPSPERLTVLDPLCGRGTTLFCALCSGANAVGIDSDRHNLKEAHDYFLRYLKTAGLKHSSRSFSTTVGSSGIPGRSVSFGLSRESYRAGEAFSLTLHEADSFLTGSLLRKSPAHLLVADLPYGVQHAPRDGSKPEPFPVFLSRILPSWKKALLPGGVAALSFNTLTLKTDAVRNALSDSGFRVLDEPVFHGLAHTVEQAVVRDVVFASLPCSSPSPSHA